MDNTRCSTADHIHLEYASKKQLEIADIRWRNVLRDSVYGISVSVLIIAAAFVVFSPAVAIGIFGGLLIINGLCAGYRLATGHKPSCAAKLATLTVFRIYDYMF